MKTAEVFDKNWKRYDDWFEKHKDIYFSELQALKPVIPKGFGLEIGIGTGRFAFPLNVKVGIDPSKNMLRLARKRGIEVIHGAGEELPFKDFTFDFVLIVVTLCFVEHPEYILHEASRVLKRGGKLIIGEINKNSELGRLYEAKREKSEFYRNAVFYSGDEIIEMMNKAGIKYSESYQTLLNGVQEIKKGFDRGGFVVIAGIKNHGTILPNMISCAAEGA